MDLSSTFESNVVEPLNLYVPETPKDKMARLDKSLIQLIKKQDIEDLVTTYYLVLKKHLPVCSVQIDVGQKHERGVLMHSPNVALDIRSSFTEDRTHSDNVNYNLTRQITIAERDKLTMLHEVFEHQIDHTLQIEALKQMVSKDALTGLKNRNAFDEDIEQMRLHCQRSNSCFGLLVIDLDNFKMVNDIFGHKEGDEILMAVSTEMKASLRANETAYRYGGDEFCCLVATESWHSLDKVARRISESVANHPLCKRHKITASIGGTLTRQHEKMTDTFERADKAMYRVKSAGKGGVTIFHE